MSYRFPYNVLRFVIKCLSYFKDTDCQGNHIYPLTINIVWGRWYFFIRHFLFRSSQIGFYLIKNLYNKRKHMQVYYTSNACLRCKSDMHDKYREQVYKVFFRFISNRKGRSIRSHQEFIGIQITRNVRH